MYELIRARFGKAIQSYDNHAYAQKEIAHTLFGLLKASLPAGKSYAILEAGCGTGNLSQLLATLCPEQFILNDLCPGYEPLLTEKINTGTAGRVRFMAGEAEILIRNLPGPFHIIASSSAIQWMKQPLRFLKDCKPILAPGGILAVSTFSPDNLSQITEIEGIRLEYPPVEEIRKTLEPHYRIRHLEEREITLSFPSPLHVLRHLKLTGVNGLRSAPWTKRDLDRFTSTYQERFGSMDHTYPLTYRPIYVILEKQ